MWLLVDGKIYFNMSMNKDLNRNKYELRKKKERELRRKKDIREREYQRGFKGQFI